MNQENMNIKGIGIFEKIDETTFFCEEPVEERLEALSVDVVENGEIQENQIELLKNIILHFDELVAKSLAYYEASEEFFSEDKGLLRYVDISIYTEEDEADFCIQHEFIQDEDSFIAIDFKEMEPVDIYGGEEEEED